MANISLLEVLLVGTGLYIVKRVLSASKSKHPPLPPGPKRKPLIGNLLDLPQPGEYEWIHWMKHKDLYGEFDGISTSPKEC